jgi:lipopolysaccharide cholinephosphotransferase
MAGVIKFKRKMLNDVVGILTENNIPYWLESGTLLGLIRNSTFLDHHLNIDIGIAEENSQKLMNIEDKFSPNYKFREVYDKSGRKWIENTVARIAILRKNDKLRDETIKVFVTIKQKKDKQMHWVDTRTCKSVKSSFFENLQKINSDGTEYSVPADVEKYLEKRYGDWKTTNDKWIGCIDDKSIVCDEIIKNIPVKERVLGIPRQTKIELKGRYLTMMEDMIFKTAEILEKNNIRYWLEAGTLLGITRDGGLIPWDNDADFGIHAEDAEKVLKIWPQFLPKYLVRKKLVQSNWLPDNMRVLKIKTPIEKVKNIKFHVDLFCLYKVDNKYRWIDNKTLKHVEEKFYDNLETIVWKGKKLYVPSHKEEYLSVRYGNWKEPVKDFDSTLHDGAIAEKGF